MSTSREEEKAVEKLRELRGYGTFSSAWRDFMHFALDYNVVGTTISFAVGNAGFGFVSSIANALERILLPESLRSVGLGSFVTMVIMVALSFIFVEFVFEPLSTSKAFAEERDLREDVKRVKNEGFTRHQLGAFHPLYSTPSSRSSHLQ